MESRTNWRPTTRSWRERDNLCDARWGLLAVIICPRRQRLPSTHDNQSDNRPLYGQLDCNIRCCIKRVQDTHAFISLSFVLLTSAHVACTPPAHSNTGAHRASAPARREHIVRQYGLPACYLGHNGHPRPTRSASLNHSVPRMQRLPTSGSRTNSRRKRRRRGLIDHLDHFHDEVTTHKRKRKPRPALSSVLLTEPFVFADGPNEFTSDCALIELYRDKIRLEEHVHGKQGLLYIGTFPIFLFCLP